MSINLIDIVPMNELILVGLAGFLAAMVDGALGMGFGPTSSTILLSTGMSPAAVSATVNLAKVASGIAGGLSHWRFGNVDRALALRLAIPGMVGALIGVTVLANVDGDQIRPLLAVLLLLVGVRILVRFSRPLTVAPAVPPGSTAARAAGAGDAGLVGAAVAGGVTNGLVGAWGPVVTPVLLHKGVVPRIVVGSVNTAEVAVATISAGSLIASLGGAGIDLGVLVAMLVGGVLAAPLAAWTIQHIPARVMGVAVAGLLLLTNVRELATWAEMGPGRWLLYAVVAALVTAAALAPRVVSRPREAEVEAA
jgi:uncharacterized membrane protein YfcA